MQLRLYYGQAGTGKTTTMIEIVKKLLEGGISAIILAPTHSACDNIRRKLRDLNVNVSTIYSYFSIDYSAGAIAPIRKKLHQNVFIDEFSLLDREMMIKLLTMLKRFEVTLWLFGDPLQLNPVYEKRISQYSLQDVENISFDALQLLQYEIKDLMCIRHIYQGLFYQFLTPNPLYKLDEVVKMTKVYRQEGSLMDEIYSIINDKNYNILSFKKMISCVKNGYVVSDKSGKQIIVKPYHQYFLSSTYALLQDIYNQTYVNINGKSVKNCQKFSYYLTLDEEYMWIGPNDKSMKNGMIVKLKKNENNSISFDNGVTLPANCTVYLQPARYLSIHKSQGLTLKNVVICIDDMFEPSMIYTALTRASNTNLLFNIHKDAIEKFDHQLDLLRDLKEFYYGEKRFNNQINP